MAHDQEPKKCQCPGGSENIIEEIGEDFDKFEVWVMQHGKLILAASVVIVLIVAGAFGAILMKKASDNKKTRLFAAAKTQEKLVEAINKYPDFPSVDDARLRLSAILVDKKDYTAAGIQLDKVVKSASVDEFLRGRAALNIAYILELQNKFKDAAQSFDSLASSGRIPDDVRAEAVYSAGRLYVQTGDSGKARNILSRLDAKTAKTQASYYWAQMSRNLLDRMDASDAPAVIAPVQAAKPVVKTAPAPVTPAKSVKK